MAAVGERNCALRALLDEEHAPSRAVLIASSVIEQHVDDARREAERRLVEQEHERVGDERPRDRELLLLPAGELAGRAPPIVAHDGKQLVRALHRGLVAVRAAAGKPEAQILLDAQLGEDAPPFGHERDPGAGDVLGGPAAEIPVAETDRARRDGGRAHDRVQRRGLPGAVRADEPDDLSGLDLERQAAHGAHRSVPDLETLHDESGHASPSS